MFWDMDILMPGTEPLTKEPGEPGVQPMPQFTEYSRTKARRTQRTAASWMLTTEDTKPLTSKAAAFEAMVRFVEAIGKVSKRLDDDPKFIETFMADNFGHQVLIAADELLARMHARDKTEKQIEDSAEAKAARAARDAVADMAAEGLMS